MFVLFCPFVEFRVRFAYDRVTRVVFWLVGSLIGTCMRAPFMDALAALRAPALAVTDRHAARARDIDP